MSLWRGILQRRDDEWTSSLRGLDGIEAKPVFHNENIPAFKHNPVHLVVRKELRSEEDFLMDFTPFICKKTEEEKARLRQGWLGSNLEGDALKDFLTALWGGETAEEAYEAQDEAGEPVTSLFGSEDLPITTTSMGEIKLVEGRTGFVVIGGGGRERDLAEIEGGGRMAGEISVALASATGQLKAMGITTPEGVRDALERAEATIARLKAEGIKSHADKQALIDAYKLQGNIYTVLGRAEEARTARGLQAETTRGRSLLTETAEFKQWEEAVNPSTGKRFTFKELKEYYKGQVGASRDVGLTGRTNLRSMYELLSEKGIKPPSRASGGGGGR